MRVFLDDIRKQQNAFQGDEQKPSTLSGHDLQSYHTAYSQSIERESELEKVESNMCDNCGKIEQSYQVALRKHQLPPIIFKGYEPIPMHGYLHAVDELHEKLKEEIHSIQDPSEEAIRKYVVDIAYSTVQLSMFVSTMIENVLGALEVNIDCECDENNIIKVQIEEAMEKYHELLA